jgi:hypothetical protein
LTQIGIYPGEKVPVKKRDTDKYHNKLINKVTSRKCSSKFIRISIE